MCGDVLQWLQDTNAVAVEIRSVDGSSITSHSGHRGLLAVSTQKVGDTGIYRRMYFTFISVFTIL